MVPAPAEYHRRSSIERKQNSILAWLFPTMLSSMTVPPLGTLSFENDVFTLNLIRILPQKTVFCVD